MSIEKVEPTARTITKRTLRECREYLNDEFGNDYTLGEWHTVVKGGFLGFGQKEWIEATYYVHEKKSAQSASAPVAPASAIERNRDDLLRTAGLNIDSTRQIAQLDRKMDDQLRMLASKIDSLATVASAQANEKHPTIQKIEELLADNEFTLSYINGIANRIREQFSLDELDDFATVERTVIDWLGKDIAIAPQHYRKPPHVIVLVGPTGVGKTTTVAKMAANIILDAKNSGKPPARVRMITIDRTRVGAEEQLRRFGEIMNIDVDKAETTDDVKQIFETYKDSLDALIIDTSGYSPNDYENIGKMRALLNVKGLDADVYLTITASTKAKDLVSIIQNYEPFNFGSVIVTKCDETSAYGNVLSVLAEKHKAISYITDGQKVPRNIERASVISFLTRLDGFTVDRIHIEDLFAGEN